MAKFNVPLILRGKVIHDADIEFGGRRGGSSFTSADVRNHLDKLPLSTPSALRDLHQLKFDDIADFLQEVGNRLSFRQNAYLQEAYELSVTTSGLSPQILKGIYETLGQGFGRSVVHQTADKSIGIPYLDGWVGVKLETGGHAWTRAFGARAVHIIAGNVPNVAAMSIMRNAVIRSDMIVKTPSNDPLTAAAVARTMIDMAPDHPITKHLSVAYWKGGDTRVEEALYTPAHVDKIVAWGGLASISHISRYIQPGIDLITLDPKLSSTIIGKEAFAGDATMREVAGRAAVDVGHRNQEACHNARVVYIQTGTDKEGLTKANRFAQYLYDSIQALPPHISGPAVAPDPALAEEVDALKMSIGYYEVVGGGPTGAVIVSQMDEPVDFARLLGNRIANLVPFDSLETPIRSTNAYTQTIGIYPDSLRTELRDRLALHGAQRLVSLGYAGRFANIGPHDGIEPLRRMCKWIVDEEYRPESVALASMTDGERNMPSVTPALATQGLTAAPEKFLDLTITEMHSIPNDTLQEIHTRALSEHFTSMAERVPVLALLAEEQHVREISDIAQAGPLLSWGGFASITHIAKYIQPGIDLITLDPKLSSSIIGKAAFQDERTMADAAQRMAIDIGSNNQEACLNARVAYIESGTDEDGLAKANRFGEMVYSALQSLPPALSTPVRRVDPQLAEEIHSLKMMSDDHRVIGGGNNGAIIVSQTNEPVDFARILTNRVANLVPVDDLEIPIRSVTAYTQTIGIYPDELKAKLRDRLAFYGAQRFVSLGYAARLSYAGPHDGLEPLRRMCKWIIEEEYDPAETPLPSKSYAEFAFTDA